MEDYWLKRRRVGKLGRTMGVSELGSHLALSTYLVNPFPEDDGSPQDFSSAVSEWGTLGNDSYGDCGPAGDVHLNMANAWTAKEQPAGNIASPTWPSADEVVKAYLQFTGGKDSGVDLGQWLLWRTTHSIGPLPPIGGFAQVDDYGKMYAGAEETFGGLYNGILVSPEAMQEFEMGQPFTSTATDWEGGHCFPHVARNLQWGRGITWGLDQLFSWEWWQACREESYVILTPAQMDAPGGVFHGVAVAKLKEDIKQLQGTLAH